MMLFKTQGLYCTVQAYMQSSSILPPQKSAAHLVHYAGPPLPHQEYGTSLGTIRSAGKADGVRRLIND